MEWWQALLYGLIGGGIAGGVVIAWWRRAMGVDDDVVDLAASVAQLRTTVRRIEMQRVRASAPAAPSAPPGFQPPLGAPATKAELRRRVFGTVRVPNVPSQQGVEVSS